MHVSRRSSYEVPGTSCNLSLPERIKDKGESIWETITLLFNRIISCLFRCRESGKSSAKINVTHHTSTGKTKKKKSSQSSHSSSDEKRKALRTSQDVLHTALRTSQEALHNEMNNDQKSFTPQEVSYIQAMNASYNYWSYLISLILAIRHKEDLETCKKFATQLKTDVNRIDILAVPTSVRTDFLKFKYNACAFADYYLNY